MNLRRTLLSWNVKWFLSLFKQYIAWAQILKVSVCFSFTSYYHTLKCAAIFGIDWNISCNMDHLHIQLDLILILLWVASTLEEQTYNILRNSYKVVRNISDMWGIFPRKLLCSVSFITINIISERYIYIPYISFRSISKKTSMQCFFYYYK